MTKDADAMFDYEAIIINLLIQGSHESGCLFHDNRKLASVFTTVRARKLFGKVLGFAGWENRYSLE